MTEFAKILAKKTLCEDFENAYTVSISVPQSDGTNYGVYVESTTKKEAMRLFATNLLEILDDLFPDEL